jgi:hypothetical protein
MDTLNKKVIYQYDLSGRLIGEATADESPREPGVYLMPARTTETAPPLREAWPENTWPRWTGTSWAMIALPKPSAPAEDPLAKLQRFLAANPDVVAAIGAATDS